MPTLRDVAKHAGVSHTTVSLVVNGDPRISPATREKVQRAVAALGFRPDATARKLARGRTGVLAVVVPELGSVFAQGVLRGVEAGLLAMGPGQALDLQIHSGRDVHPDGTDAPHRIALTERVLAERKADAVILLTAHGDEPVRRPADGPWIPVVAVEHSRTYDRLLTFDNEGGGRLAMEHLLARGRRRIALVNGDAARMRTPQDRERGARAALRAAGLDLPAASVLTVYMHHFSEGKALWPAVKAGGFDAVFCAAGDQVALGLMAAAAEDGARFPQDLALVGFDGLESAEAVGLSTVEQPMQAMGRRAVELALQCLAEGPTPPAEERFQPLLRARRSS